MRLPAPPPPSLTTPRSDTADAGTHGHRTPTLDTGRRTPGRSDARTGHRTAVAWTGTRGHCPLAPDTGRRTLYDLGCYCVSAARLFGGHPTRVWAERVLDGAAGPNGGVDLRLAATMRLPDQVLALFDVSLDLVRRGELELVGTGAG
jgi:predicted dehydrogenase